MIRPLSVFDQHHIFVVFNPGSGGNFLAGIINNIFNLNLTSLDISSTGSSHTVLRDKSTGTDYLSFGTLMEEHDQFLNEEERESFYIENIKKTYTSENSKPEVIWSHDFTNIPLYRKYFKNSKILVINNDTPDEQITALFMLAKKTLLDKNCLLPISRNIWEIIVDKWSIYCMKQLLLFKNNDEATKMINDRFNDEYKDDILYATVRDMLSFYGMLHLVEDTPEQKILYKYVIYPATKTIGKQLAHYVDDKCTILPYKYLAASDHNLLVEKLSAILERKLNSNELSYVRASFDKYRSSQDQLLLSNPIFYYKNLRNVVLNKIQ